MSSKHEHEHNHSHQCGCCNSLDRRDFMATVGLASLAAPGVFSLASAAMGGESAAAAKPRVRAVFLRPDTDKGDWMSWPGVSFDNKAGQALYTKVMSDAAKNLDVNLEVDVVPIVDLAAVDKLLAECKKNPPDGMIITVMELGPASIGRWPTSLWPNAARFPPSSSVRWARRFTGHLQETRKAKKCFTASTQDHGWLATAVKMLRTIWDMKNTRICIINGDKTHDQQLDVIGTTLHHIPLDRWTDELAKLETTAEVQALADEFARTAKKIVEPKPLDLINAAKTYFVAKRIMAAENCQGISLNCLGLVAAHRIPCPPCMALAETQRRRGHGRVRMRLERGNLAAALPAVDRPAGLHARPRAEHGQQHVHGRPLHLGQQTLRLRQAGRAGDSPQPHRVGHRHFAAGASGRWASR